MNRITGPSGRAWAMLAVPLVVLLALFARDFLPGEERVGLHAVPGALSDVRLPGGATAALSRCGSPRSPRPEAAGQGEQDGATPSLAIASYGYSSSGPAFDGAPAFTVSVRIDPGSRPLLLPASPGTHAVAEHRVTIDIQGAHGEGRTASARGLTARVMQGYGGKPASPSKSGAYRFTRPGELILEIDLPRRAVCPGHSVQDVGRCAPDTTNRIEDCPAVAVTLTDESVRLHRAAEAGFASPKRFSDRLVAVWYEESAAKA